MANIRREFGDDLTLKNGNLGINTTTAQERVDVVGVVKGTDLNVTGVTSLTAYEGFLRADNQIVEETNLEFGNGLKASLSGEIIVGTGQTIIINDVVKDTAGVGVGTNPQWRNLLDTGNARIVTSPPPVWNGKDFVFNDSGGFRVDNYSETFETSITVEWWGTSDYPDTDYHVPVLRTSTSSWNDGFGFHQREGKIVWWVNAWNGTQKTEIAATSFGMTHWVGTYDGSNLKLYRNGSLVDTGSSFTANVTEPSDGLLIGEGGGNDSSSGYYWDGNIRIVRIYSRALTASEISSQYELGSESLLTVAEPDAAHFNANNPLSYPGKVNSVDTTDINLAGGSQIECLKVYNTFTPPAGGTNERPYKPKPGELYYNYDFKTIEFHDGYGWRQVDNTTRSGRGLYGGGRVEPGSPTTATVGYINIHSLGNAQYFGDLTNGRQNPGACSSSTRGLWGGGTPGFEIDYVTIASAGNATDFGNLSVNRYLLRGLSSSTRGIWASGWTGSSSDVIDYVEISTTGNALDFGDMTSALNASACTSSPTRGLITGGRTPSTYYPLIEFITIASKGDAVDFGGDLTKLSAEHAGVSNGTLGLFMGGQTPALSSQCEFVKISSSGNGVFFGDLTEVNSNGSATSTNTRGVYIGGRTPSIVNTMEYVTFSSLGNAIDFGDMSAQTKELDACSDSHGGLGGF